MALLIFDCDGVLVDSEILHAQIECELAKDWLGIDSDPIEHNRRFSGGGLKPVYAAWERQSGKPLPDGIEQEMQRRKNEAFATRMEAIPYMAAALDQLGDFTFCVASGTPAATLDVALKKAGLRDYFGPYLFSADMVAHGKPAPDLFLHAALQMGHAPAECLVIEDSVHGVHAACAAGMPVIGFTGASHCGPGHAAKLDKADRIIDDMRLLPGIVREFFPGRAA